MIKTTERIEGKLIQSIHGADRQRIDIFFLEEENKYFIFLVFGNSLYNTQEMVGYFYTFEDLRNAKIIKVPVEEIIRDVKHVAHMYTQDISVQGV